MLIPHKTAASLMENARECPKEIRMAITATAAFWQKKVDSCGRTTVITSSAADQRLDRWQQHRTDWLSHDVMMRQRVQDAQDSEGAAWWWAKAGGVTSLVLTAVVVVQALAK